jgi:hypothetical protein
MYVHPKFAVGGEEALELAGRVDALVAHDGAAPVAAHLPFLVTARAADDVRIAFHAPMSHPVLDGQSDATGHAIADMMRALRPALDYGGETA